MKGLIQGNGEVMFKQSLSTVLANVTTEAEIKIALKAFMNVDFKSLPAKWPIAYSISQDGVVVGYGDFIHVTANDTEVFYSEYDRTRSLSLDKPIILFAVQCSKQISAINMRDREGTVLHNSNHRCPETGEQMPVIVYNRNQFEALVIGADNSRRLGVAA